MSPGKFIARQIIYWMIGTFVFILIASEIFGNIYLHYFLQKSSRQKFHFDSYRIYAHRPNFREGDGNRDWIVINGQGFRRTKDVPKKKPQKTFRAFLLGGSAAHGISSAAPYPIRHIYPDETIDAYLEKIMTHKYSGHNIEIINAAVTGYQVFQHTQYILSELLDYSPDLIIFFDGANDHYTNNPDYDYYGDNIYQFWKSRLQSPSFGGITDYTFLWLTSYSAFAKGYFAWKLQNDAVRNAGIINMNKTFEDRNKMIEQHKEVAKKQFLRSTDINVLLLKKFGIKAIVSLQPMLVLRESVLLSQQEKDFLRENEIVTALYPVVKAELKELAGSYRVPFIDMIPFFNDPSLKGKQLFIDYTHLSPEGSEVAAKALFPSVENVFLEAIYRRQNARQQDLSAR
jgi:hypothetical protein